MKYGASNRFSLYCIAVCLVSGEEDERVVSRVDPSGVCERRNLIQFCALSVEKGVHKV
jgi:hypothetical protein